MAQYLRANRSSTQLLSVGAQFTRRGEPISTNNRGN
jgi:hypothetical protein